MSVVQLRLILDFAPGSSSLSYKLHIVINNNCHILKKSLSYFNKIGSVLRLYNWVILSQFSKYHFICHVSPCETVTVLHLKAKWPHFYNLYVHTMHVIVCVVCTHMLRLQRLILNLSMIHNAHLHFRNIPHEKYSCLHN